MFNQLPLNPWPFPAIAEAFFLKMQPPLCKWDQCGCASETHRLSFFMCQCAQFIMQYLLHLFHPTNFIISKLPCNGLTFSSCYRWKLILKMRELLYLPSSQKTASKTSTFSIQKMASSIKEISFAIDRHATVPLRNQTQTKGYSSIRSSQLISVYFVLKKQLKPHSSSFD